MVQTGDSGKARTLWPTAEQERRWTIVMDAVIGASVVIWTLLLAFADPSETLRWVVPLIIALMVVHRVLVLVEHTHRHELTEQPLTMSAPGPRQDAAHAA